MGIQQATGLRPWSLVFVKKGVCFEEEKTTGKLTGYGDPILGERDQDHACRQRPADLSRVC